MTQNDIIKAALKVWGRDLYRTTSLSQVAQELGVSKPALYRHFSNKDALLDAMYTFFYDDFAGFMKNGYENALNAGDCHESFLIWIRAIGEYYVRNRETLLFSLVQVYNNRNKETLRTEFELRGINFAHPAFRGSLTMPYPSKMQLTMATLLSCVAQFHHHDRENMGLPIEGTLQEDLVNKIVSGIEDRVIKGLNLDAQRVMAMNYETLEERVTGTVYEDTETNALLRAVAAAVAEAGPWNASMEMVAQRSGLSKSGLYAHFKNKQDMLTQLFITEFSTMANFAKAQIENTSVFEEQLYVTIVSIVDYLRSRPEILLSLDWIKTGRLDLGKELPLKLFQMIKSIKVEAIQNFDGTFLVRIAEWVLFMIVNTLALWPSNQGENSTSAGNSQGKNWALKAAEVPNESFRLLFRYIALGLEGLN